jgi:minor extracellular serine protease Vpr
MVTSEVIMPRSLALFVFLAVAAFPQQLKQGPFLANRYMLILEDAPVAARFGPAQGLRSAAADAYRQQVQVRQRILMGELARRNIAVTAAASEVLNAVFVSATPDRVAELRQLPGVAEVRPRRRIEQHLNAAVQLMNGPAAWTALGGQQNAGKGIKIAIIDSGIDQNHPAFQDATLAVPSGFPKCNVLTDCRDYTNNKVIVARSYVPLFMGGSDPKNPAADSRPDDASARDRNGHGTAVASAAAGNSATGAVTITGMAPKAWLGSYKVGGSPGVNDGSDEAAMIVAIDDAVKDGMDVAVVSSGATALSGPLDTGTTCGLTGATPCDALAYAFENAAKAGIVIVASAGNDGDSGPKYPNLGTVSSPAFAPSVLAVGASTSSHAMVPAVTVNDAAAPAALRKIPAVLGDSYSVLYAYSVGIPETAPLVDVASLGNDGLACAPLPADSLVNKFALVQRGSCFFADKATAVQDAGAIGLIVYMADSAALFPPGGADQFYGSVVMISNADGVALKSYLASHPGVSTTIDLAGREQDVTEYGKAFSLNPALAANQLASYSSAGPSTGLAAAKPDLVATGGLDVGMYLRPDWPNYNLPAAPGMYLATQTYDPLGDMWSPSGYAAADGTSFSAPLVGGAAALVKQAHPDYKPADIRSALVNSAAADVTVDDTGLAVGVESVGAGRLDAAAALKATVIAAPTNLSFGALKTGVALPAAIPVTLVNRGSSPVTLAVTVTPGIKVSGIAVDVDSTSLTLAAGASAILTAKLTGAAPATAGNYSGVVALRGTGVSLNIPYLFVVGNGVPYNLSSLLGSGAGIAGQSMGSWLVGITDSTGLPVEGASVSFSASPRGSMTFTSVTGAPACTGTTASLICPTDKYGFAWVEIQLGTTIGTASVVVGAVGGRYPITVYSMAQPTIAAGGVLAAANVDKGTAVAPGSYIAIYGTDLSEYEDAAINTILPLSLDGVTVSFDVPSAGISVPAALTYVSPNQVNVQAPWELAGQASAQVKVTLYGMIFGNVVTAPLSDYAPAFFHTTVDALDVDYKVIAAGNPAKRGQVVQLFMNALGPVTEAPASGSPASAVKLSETTTKPVVMIGGQPATVHFSGLAPGFPGLYQVNVTVPAGISAGSAVPVTVAIGGKTSKESTIPVQ